MQLEISGRHMEVSAAMRERLDKKMRHIAKRMEKPPSRVHAVLAVEKERRLCEIQMHAGRDDFFVRSESDDLYAAIDAAADKLWRQIETGKGRKIARRNHSGE